MAEVNNNPTQKKRKGSSFFSKKNVRVDLTPMVDLGFILVTFFVFTTSMVEPKVMDVINPNDSDSTIKDPICESCVITVLLGKENKIWYYEGMEENAVYKESSFQSSGIREVISQKKKAVFKNFGKDRFILIIKPLPNSGFKNMVDMIDEANINVVKRYYIDEPSKAEKEKYE